MKNKKKQFRKELSNKLIAAVMTHLDGLKKKKQSEITRYVEAKMDSVAGYYTNLLTKKTKNEMMFAVPESDPLLVKSSEEGRADVNTEMINQAK